MCTCTHVRMKDKLRGEAMKNQQAAAEQITCESFQQASDFTFLTKYCLIRSVEVSVEYDDHFLFSASNMEEGPLHFYHLNEPFGEFSNFYPSPIELDGHTWSTTEHYFQAQKFIADETHFHNVLQLPKPREAFLYPREHRSAVRSDWAQVKDGIMLTACMAKFEQHLWLRELLLSTGNRQLVEHTTKDSYWGDGGDGSGRNQLGITLMQVRSNLREKQS
jgi:N-glycosidase YbiA